MLKISVALVLCGSAVRIMETLDSAGAPLFGRLSWKKQLQPFDYWDTAKMVSFDDLREQALTYGVFGGMPRYLAPVDSKRSLGKNVADLILAPDGEIRIQIETALHQEQGLRDSQKYLGILHAVGGGKTELSDIAARAGLENDTTIRAKINRLLDLGYVTRQRNFDAGKTTPWRYKLADPAFRFYYEFVVPLESALARTDPEEVWLEFVEPQLDRYMGHLFEEIVEQAYGRHRKEGSLPIVESWARWEGKDRDGKSLEMDIVARQARGALLTGAIKWNRRPVSIDLHRRHMRDLYRLAQSGQQWAHQAMEEGSQLLYVAAGGFDEGFHERAREEGLPVTLWTLEDLY